VPIGLLRPASHVTSVPKVATLESDRPFDRVLPPVVVLIIDDMAGAQARFLSLKVFGRQSSGVARLPSQCRRRQRLTL
jgi:hypothetical protein